MARVSKEHQLALTQITPVHTEGSVLLQVGSSERVDSGVLTLTHFKNWQRFFNALMGFVWHCALSQPYIY